MLALAPVLARPTISIVLAFIAVAGWLAWRSVAYPLALVGIPAIVTAIAGSNPLPKGGVTFLLAAWIGLAIVFVIMRGEHRLPGRLLLSAPVALSLLLLGLMILRLGQSPGEEYGSMKTQLFVADNLVLFVGALFVGARRQDLRLFLLLVLVVSAGGALLLLFELVSGSAQASVGERFSLGAQEYPIYLARSSADGLMIAIYVILVSRNPKLRLLALGVLPMLFAAMIAAGSRGPVLAFLFGLVILVALSATGARARRRLAQVVAGLLIATILVPVIIPGSAAGRALSAIVGGASGLSSNGRTQLWSQAFTLFGQHPLFGIGTGGFSGLNVESYPHNILLEVAAELGLIGLVVLVGFLVTSLTRLISTWRVAWREEKLDAAVLIALFLTALVNAFFSGAIQDNHEIWLWAGLGIGMSTRMTRMRQAISPASAFTSPQWTLHDDWTGTSIPARTGKLGAR